MPKKEFCYSRTRERLPLREENGKELPASGRKVKGMRTLLRWSSRLKWLGLLGLPMFLSEQPVWKWMWLFWLFGILEIALSFPIFLQSLRQLAGIVICSCKNRPMPDKDNFLPKITYSLPFEGAWTIVNGGVSREASHSWDINSQR